MGQGSERGLGGKNKSSNNIVQGGKPSFAQLLTHDVSTITRYAYEQVEAGKPMPGVFEVGRDIPMGIVIEDLILLTECSLGDEWEGQVRYLPLR